MIRMICNIAGLIGGAAGSGFILSRLAEWSRQTLEVNGLLAVGLLFCLAMIGWAIAGIARAEG